jgi:hypothetical protein
MKKYTYYSSYRHVIGIRYTKGNAKDVLELISKHGAVEKYEIDDDTGRIDFTQHWPRDNVQSLKRGDWVTSENAGLKVYGNREFKDQFTQIYSMPSYYSPTDDEVKVLECLNRDAEMCYPYSYICDETKLTRHQAKAAIDRLRSFGAVKCWVGLMTEEGDVAGSGFCWGDPHKAEALLYRYYGNGEKK